jgi:ribulose-5-phosphate 4-epimerase/fuculose-1-phosphate aldolase
LFEIPSGPPHRRVVPRRGHARLGRPAGHAHPGAGAAQRDHFLNDPCGLLFEEITASNLVKVDAHCNIRSQTERIINRPVS